MSKEELIKEFEQTWGYIPDMDVFPRQLKYQFKLFLLEKGLYGIKPNQSKETQPTSTAT
jgi:hypothetical protein